MQRYDTLQAGHAVSGDLSRGKIDVYKVSLQAGTLYRIKVVPESLRDPQLMLLGTGGAERPYEAYDDDSGVGYGSQIDYTSKDSGTYQILVLAVTDSDTGSYKLSARPLERDGGDIRPGQTLSRSIATAGEQDRFTVSLQAGTRYRIETTLGTLDDSELVLIDPNGSVVASNDNISDANPASRIDYTAMTSGLHTIQVEGQQQSHRHL